MSEIFLRNMMSGLIEQMIFLKVTISILKRGQQISEPKILTYIKRKILSSLHSKRQRLVELKTCILCFKCPFMKEREVEHTQ